MNGIDYSLEAARERREALERQREREARQERQMLAALEETTPRRRRRKKKRNRLKKFRRRDNEPFPWGMDYAVWCFKCRREIRENDLAVLDTFYDDEGRADSWSHYNCSDHSDRPRVPRPEASVYITSEGIRRLSMTMKTKKARKSRKQKAVKENDETQATIENEAGAEEVSEKPRKKSKKTKKAEATESNGGSPRASFAQTTGEALLPLLEEAGATKKVQSIASKLAKGNEVDHDSLVTLRDSIKELGAVQRGEDGDASLASQLSAINARVRRLERNARA